MRRIEFAEHQVHQATELGTCACAFDLRTEPLAHRVPVCAVIVLVIESVAHLAPTLLERGELRRIEVLVPLDRCRNGARLSASGHGDDAQLTGLRQIELSAVAAEPER